MNKNILMLIAGIILVGLASAATSVSSSSSSFRDVNTQFYQPSINTMYSQDQISTYWPILSNKNQLQCEGRQDFVVQIAPAGCTPTVVRSDILEEQNVPVFCRLTAAKMNPLIDVKSIDRIIPSIRGQYPEGISGLGYYPARAALRSYDNLLGSPLINDIGYVVVILKRNEIEKSMPDWIEANMTAVLKYDLGNAWGVGRSEYYLPVMGEDEWQRDYAESEFWKGKGFLKVESKKNLKNPGSKNYSQENIL